jgi:thiol-disulfide isomerase/thioredoxin
MPDRRAIRCIGSLTALLIPAWPLAAQRQQQPQTPQPVIQVKLEYAAPADGKPKPNFSPKGTQVALTDVAPGAPLPPGAVRPARKGMLQVGPSKTSWIPVLVTASAEHPNDLVQLFIDRNRNGSFADDGPAQVATPTQNEKTKAWWSSINKVELTVTYGGGRPAQPYLVNFWSVREDSAGAPDIIRYSVGSWRQGKVTVDSVEALVAAMDGDNNALFDKSDMWSVLPASAPDAEKAVLSINEARATNRLMFLTKDGKDIPLEFRSFSPDGSSARFVIVNRAITKLADRAPDDLVRDERGRPRTETPVVWGKELTPALAEAKSKNRKVLIDFEATWCGPCHTMDQWIWNDAEVAQAINAGYVGIKVDADLQKALVKRLKIEAYPTMMVMGADGAVLQRVTDYQSSKQMLAFLGTAR